MLDLRTNRLGLDCRKTYTTLFVHFRAAATAFVVCLFITPAEGRVSVAIPRVDHVERPRDLIEDSRVTDRLVRIEGFVQRTPNEGAPAAWQTIVHVGYDERNLYLLFTARDPEPSRIRATLTSREEFEGDDTVLVLLDTFRDLRTAYAFRVNPFGVQWDGIWSEAGGFDASFDLLWHSGGRLTVDGYQSWMAIPWKNLRFPRGDGQSFGVILGREVPRGVSETSYWPGGRRVAGWLQQAGLFTGIRGITQGRNVQLIPFSTFRSFEFLEPESTPDERTFVSGDEATAGLDAKLVLRDRFVFDAALNPDFSQVESDEPQITVNRRFETFFPERRPFFLENADLFATSMNLLFTRRIADPELGLRFTGKAGSFGFGAILVDDEAPGKLAPPESSLAGEKATIGVVRAIRQYHEQSWIGALYTAHEISGSRNQVVSIDGRWRIDPHWFASGQVAATRTRDPSTGNEDDAAFEVVLSREGRRLNYAGGYREIGESFRSFVGFVPRTGIRDTRHFLSYWIWPRTSSLVFWGPELEVERVWASDGTPLDSFYEASLEWHFPGPSAVELNYGIGTERLRLGELHHGSRDVSFPRRSWSLEYETASSAWFEIEGELEWGRGINFEPPPGAEPSPAHFLESELELILRPLRSLRTELIWLHAEVEDAASRRRILTNDIVGARFHLQLSRELSFRLIGEYERLVTDRQMTSRDPQDRLNLDGLLTYRINPWTALFAGYNSNYRGETVFPPGMDSPSLHGGRFRDSQQLFVKLSYLIRP